MLPLLALLPLFLPQDPPGTRTHTGAFVVPDDHPARAAWQRPPVRYDPAIATGRKLAKVIVLIYDPPLAAHGDKGVIEHVNGNDPEELSRILVHVLREASWGYLNCEIVAVIRRPVFPVKVDGFRYTEETYLQARRTKQWQPSTISYRALFEDDDLLARCRREQITEIWLWGVDGMHFDEFAGWVKDRYARFGPTANPWLYRPYDIPPELGRTTWVMGFNTEVGADNMIHSYVHRVESMAALAFGDGIWDPAARRDPWNVFSWLEMDHRDHPSHVGNCHVPPNGESGYDYANRRRVLSWADLWHRYPDLRGEPTSISSQAWGGNQFGYQQWILQKVPKGPGATGHGYNNWWVYIANTDGDLPEWKPPDPGVLRLPEAMPEPGR
jgi:hypothetical protein